MSREVYSQLLLEVAAPTRLVLQVAAAHHPGAQVEEQLTLSLDGVVQRAQEFPGPHRGRVHLLDCRPGQLEISYAATVSGHADEVAAEELDAVTYLRPSRYAESDRLAALAAAEFGGLSVPELVAGVSSWVGDRLDYVSGSSGPTDGAVDTLLAGAGVCRDYAHLVVALLRAMDVPARVVAVYAPGLFPMDFHAVAEAVVDGHWQVVDATLLAPRSSLVRIATGRDAADTAFLSNYGGPVYLHSTQVRAVVSGDLPGDDVAALVRLS